MSSKPEIFISEDVEANGQVPGIHSMLSIGAVALDLEKRVHGTFYANLETLPGATADPETMNFWAQNPDAYAATRVDPVEPAVAIPQFHAFLQNLPARPVFIGYPAGYDWTFHHWYMIAYAGEDPCGHAPMCLKSFAAGMLKLPFRESAKRNYPIRWFDGLPHSHHALVDAIGQGIMGINMIRECRGLPAIDTPPEVRALVDRIVMETTPDLVRS